MIKEFFVLGQKETKWGKVETVAVLGILASCAIQHVLPVPLVDRQQAAILTPTGHFSKIFSHPFTKRFL